MGQLEIPICASTGQFAPDFCTRNGPEFEGLNIGAKFVIFAQAGDGGLLAAWQTEASSSVTRYQLPKCGRDSAHFIAARCSASLSSV
jgi:hypothetical protein